MEELLAYLNSIHPLSEEAIQYLSLHLKEIELSRKDYLLKAGRVCENVYFIKKGLVRCFYVKDDNEVCSWFMKEGDLIFSVKSFYKQIPSDESIQVLEDLTAYYLSYKELQHVY